MLSSRLGPRSASSERFKPVFMFGPLSSPAASAGTLLGLIDFMGIQNEFANTRVDHVFRSAG
eukprot:15231455-Alexandrium_andersonii.AAC.1